MKIVFPKRNAQRYWDIHYRYVLNILEKMGEVSFGDRQDIDQTSFWCDMDGKKVAFDFCDSNNDRLMTNMYDAMFKFHFKEGMRDFLHSKLFPFTPISFHDWNKYETLSKIIQYKAEGIVLNNQRPYGGALERRKKVQVILNEVKADISLTDQFGFWTKINNCLVSVCVPGATNNMIDRGQLQYMAFGCATISPELPEMLPFNRKIEAGIHYIKCKDDYSNLLELIEWCKLNKNECINIGNNAKQLFLETSTPKKLEEWIKSKI